MPGDARSDFQTPKNVFQRDDVGDATEVDDDASLDGAATLLPSNELPIACQRDLARAVSVVCSQRRRRGYKNDKSAIVLYQYRVVRTGGCRRRALLADCSIQLAKLRTKTSMTTTTTTTY